ncbi:MAG: FeoA family protein [Anaerolineae bacterium]|nr:FeoA family protein [Anaerolineae bacterium]
MVGVATVRSEAIPLIQAEEGARVRVVALRGGEAFTRRLTELGLNVGSELIVRQRQGSALVVSRDGTRFALGAGMAQRVWVRLSQT